jgi:hypothetical protein
MHAGPHMGSTARNVFSKEKNFELVICAVGDWASDRPPRALGSAVARECGIGFAQRSSGAAADSSLLSFQSAAAASSSRSRPSRKPPPTFRGCRRRLRLPFQPVAAAARHLYLLLPWPGCHSQGPIRAASFLLTLL